MLASVFPPKQRPAPDRRRKMKLDKVKRRSNKEGNGAGRKVNKFS